MSGGDDDGKSGHHHHHHHHHEQQYGTFQGGPLIYPQQPPALGFPQPVPPPGVAASAGHPASAPAYYAHGYQAVPGYGAVAEGRPVRQPRLPCCGIGMGWLLFIIGFFLAAIPWYVAAFIMLCVRIDPREKPGYVACTIAVRWNRRQESQGCGVWLWQLHNQECPSKEEDGGFKVPCHLPLGRECS